MKKETSSPHKEHLPKKSTANSIVNGENLNAFPEIRNKTETSALTTFMQHGPGASNQWNQATKRN